MDKTKESLQRDIVCNCLKLRRASQAITKLYDRFLEPSGLKISQYSLLRHIQRMEPVNVSDLAVKMKLDRTTLVRNLKLVEEKGLVSDVSKKGARDRRLTLTENGKKVLAFAGSLWQEAQDYVERYLGTEELDALSSSLAKIEKM